MKNCADYNYYVQTPMDLSTMRHKLNSNKYRSREDFVADVTQIVQNSAAYNGPSSPLTTAARSMVDTCFGRFGQAEERLKKLEKLINPLLDDNDQVALSYLFKQVITDRLKTVEGSSAFHYPVSRKLVKVS